MNNRHPLAVRSLVRRWLLLAGLLACAGTPAVADVLFAFNGAAQEELGASVACAGDVDGDGVDDFIFGAPGFSSGAQSSGAGRARVCSGASGQHLHTWQGETAWQFGQDVSAAGDLDADGHADLLVAGGEWPAGFTPTGARAFSGVDGSQLFEFTNANGGLFAVTDLADVNSDGHADFVLAHIDVATGAIVVGVHSGASGLLIGGYTDWGNELDVDSAGDVDADGVADILVCKGTEVVLLSGNAPGTVLRVIQPPSMMRCTTASGLGDVNGDGHDDIVLGFDSNIGVGRYRVHSGVDGAVLAQGPADVLDVAGPGDVTGDGIPDILIAKESNLRVLSGATFERFRTLPTGSSVAGCQDFDSDGRNEIIVGLVMPWGGPGSVAIQSVDLPVARTCSPAVPNSIGIPAWLRISGSLHVARNNLALAALDLPWHRFGVFLLAAQDDFVAGPAGSTGNLCLQAPFYRLGTSAFDSGSLGYAQVALDLVAVPGFGSVSPGQTLYFQAWYRDVGATSNFSDAIGVTFD